MKRTVDIEIAGKTWPMCLTLKAFGDICDRYGGLSDCLEHLDALVETKDHVELIGEYMWLLDCLLLAQHRAVDNGYECAQLSPPTYEALKDLFSPGDMLYIQQKVLECIRAGQAREVGAEAPKNGVGAEAAE